MTKTTTQPKSRNLCNGCEKQCKLGTVTQDGNLLPAINGTAATLCRDTNGAIQIIFACDSRREALKWARRIAAACPERTR